jgi:tyrosine-specific transport protein
MFELWLAAVLGSGSMSSGGAAAAAGALEGGAVEVLDPLAVLRGTGGGLVTPLIDTFTLLAVFTSAIGFCLGLTDFFADALKARARGGGGGAVVVVTRGAWARLAGCGGRWLVKRT